jgi:hypothetical protein
MIGSVKSVYDDKLGGEATVAQIAGDLSLTLDSTDDFNEDGGQLITPLEVVAYSAADFDALTITLVPPGLTATVSIGDWISPYQESRSRVAEVDLGDGEPVITHVPHSLWELLKPGTRSPDQEEKVNVEQKGTQAVITDVFGKSPESNELFATSVTIIPGVSDDIPLVIQDTYGTGGPWTQWDDENGVGQARVDHGGSFKSKYGFMGVVGLGDDKAVVGLLPVVASVGFSWGGTNDYDALITHSGTRELTLDGNGLGIKLIFVARTSHPGAPPAGQVAMYGLTSGGVTKMWGMGPDGTPHALW